jgi:hypothetical protein
MLKYFAFSLLILFGGLLDFLFLRPAVTRPAIDFAQFYFAGQLVSQGNAAQIYQRDAYLPLVAAVQGEDFRYQNPYYFNRPAFAAPFYVPYTLVSYTVGSRIFLALNCLLWALMIWKMPQWLGSKPSVRIWMLFLFPLAYSIAVGQDTLLVTLLLTYSMCVLIHRNETAAGIVLGLCLIKPHLIVLMPLLLLLHRKHRALLSFLATGMALAAMSVALVGIHGIAEWLELLNAPTTDYHPEVMGTVRALGLQFGSVTGWTAAIIAVSAAAIAFSKADYMQRLSILLLLTLLLGPHAYWGDYALLTIIALTTKNRAIRYAILIPWPFFTSVILWPVVLLSIGFLVLMALDSIGQKSPGFEWEGSTRNTGDITTVSSTSFQ